MTFWDDVGDPLWLSTHLSDCLSYFVPKILAIKVAIKLRSRPQKVVLGPPICRGVDTPDFGHAFSNRSYFLFRACGRCWLSSVQRARRLCGEKKKKKESLVKHKSADILCRAA